MKENELKLLDEKGVETVLREIAQGQHGREDSPLRSEVDAWVQSKILSKRDAREAETLRIARRANLIAWIAMIITTILSIISIINHVSIVDLLTSG